MIRRCEFDRALLLVRRSRVHAEIEARLRPSRIGGRPRQLAVDVFLAALILTVMTKKNLALTLVHEVLTKDLAVSYRIQLGVLTDGQPITVRQVRYLLEAIETKLAYTEERAPDLSVYDRAERRLALQNIFNRLLAACRPGTFPMAAPRPSTTAASTQPLGASVVTGPTAPTHPTTPNDGEPRRPQPRQQGPTRSRRQVPTARRPSPGRPATRTSTTS